MRLRVIHTIAGLDPVYGGPSYSVPRLCEALALAGVQTTLYSVTAQNEPPNTKERAGFVDSRFARDFCSTPISSALRLSSALARALRQAAPEADVIHNHGLWLMPNIYAGREASRARKPLVISPRGMLSPEALAFSRLKKRAFWMSMQGAVVRRAACIHATSETECQELRALGLNNPIAVIPNGIDIPDLPATSTRGSDRIVLSLGRVHPKKQLDHLVQAWARVEEAYPAWRLRIVGPAELSHDLELRALANTLGLQQVSIEGAIYGEEKLAAYRDADLVIVPTRNENFGLTVAESLAAGTPVICSKGAPWSGLVKERCGWWIDQDVEALASALARAMAMPRMDLKEMGARGRSWVERDFAWGSVAEKMSQVYQWLAGARSMPVIVHTAHTAYGRTNPGAVADATSL